jgi:hypothetical protein
MKVGLLGPFQLHSGGGVLKEPSQALQDRLPPGLFKASSPPIPAKPHTPGCKLLPLVSAHWCSNQVLSFLVSPVPPPEQSQEPRTQCTRRKKTAMKYVLVTGGVVSGLGKGVTASSIGVVLKSCGLRVTTIKIGRHSCPLAS